MKIKRAQLERLLGVVEELGRAVNPIKFSYAVAKNLRIMRHELEVTGKILEPSEKVREYEKKRVELCQKFSRKEGGRPVFKEGPDGKHFVIEDSTKEQFNKEMVALTEVYKADMDGQMTKVDAYAKALSEEVDLDFHMIAEEDMPKNISPVHLEAIMDWIWDSKKEAARS
jgi:hypothetical protein